MLAVSGCSWIDHEFSTSFIEPNRGDCELEDQRSFDAQKMPIPEVTGISDREGVIGAEGTIAGNAVSCPGCMELTGYTGVATGWLISDQQALGSCRKIPVGITGQLTDCLFAM